MPTCSFCQIDDDQRTYVEGNDAFICSECITILHEMVIQRGIRTQSDLEQTGKQKKAASKKSKEFVADRFYFFSFAQVQKSFGVELLGISNQPLYVFENTETGDAIGVYGSEDLKEAEIIENPSATVTDVIGLWIEAVGRDDFNYVTSYEEGDTFVFELIQAAKDENSIDFEREFEKPVAILANDELQSAEFLLEHAGKVGMWMQRRDELEITFDPKSKKLIINSDLYKEIGAAVNEVLTDSSDLQTVALIEGSENAQVWGSQEDGDSENSTEDIKTVCILQIGKLKENWQSSSNQELNFYTDTGNTDSNGSSSAFEAQVFCTVGRDGDQFAIELRNLKGESSYLGLLDEDSFDENFVSSLCSYLEINGDKAGDVLYILKQLYLLHAMQDFDVTADLEEAFEGSWVFQVGQGDTIESVSNSRLGGLFLEVYPIVSLDWSFANEVGLEFDMDAHIECRSEANRFVGYTELGVSGKDATLNAFKTSQSGGAEEMAKASLEFQIKRGVVDMDSIEEDDTKEIVEKCLKLCKAKKHEEAVELLLPLLSFEWIWGNCDGDPSDIFETVDDVAFDLSKKNSIVQVGESDGNLVITATVQFDAKIKKGVKEGEITEWLSDNSAYACGYVGAAWLYSESDGDNVWLTKLK